MGESAAPGHEDCFRRKGRRLSDEGQDVGRRAQHQNLWGHGKGSRLPQGLPTEEAAVKRADCVCLVSQTKEQGRPESGGKAGTPIIRPRLASLYCTSWPPRRPPNP